MLLFLSVLCRFSRSVAKDPSPEEFASQLYEKASEQVATFFKNAGTPVTDYDHPSLRTADTEIHPRATAHFIFYRDDKCTHLDYIVDYKISRCLNILNYQRIRIVSEQDSTWTLVFDQYDASCENYLGMGFDTQSFPKNICVPYYSGSMTFNLIAHPLKAIPGGAAAFVYYDNLEDCLISKHTNLGRAGTVATIPTSGCSTGQLGPVNIVSCDSSAVTFQHYHDSLCTQPWVQNSYSTVAAEACPVEKLSPYQVLCITDSGV
jgi:hypothetical protein